MTATVRDRATGRFRAIRTDWPVCPTCGSLLHERLNGDLVCVIEWCKRTEGTR